MKKIFYLFLAFSLVLMITSGAMAGSVTINDNPANGPYTDLQQWTTGASPGYLGNTSWHDLEGSEFATDKIVVNLNPDSFVIQIYTNNAPGGLTVGSVHLPGETDPFNFGVADIAINAGSGTASYDSITQSFFPGQTSNYELAIITQAYADNVNGGAAYLVNVDTWTTSLAEVNTLTTTGHYGGGWVPSDQASKTIATTNMPVEVLASYVDDPILTGIISWEDGGTIADWLITITFDEAWSFSTFDLLWGTSLCANDVVAGQVPLPPSALLLGTGLLGFVGLGWRRRKIEA